MLELTVDPAAPLADIKRTMIARHVELVAEAARQRAEAVCLQELFYGPYFCAEQETRWYQLTERVPDGPTTDGQPSFSFWIDEASMADILGQRDFLAFSKFPGFESRPVPDSWTIKDYI